MSVPMRIYLSELFGTALLVLMGLSVVANISLKKSGFHGAGGVAAALGWGAAMTTAAVIVGPISGAHCNPAFTIGFWIAGKVETALVPGYIISQIAGAFLGAIIVWYLFKDHLDAEENAEVKLGVFVTGPSIRNPIRNMMAEVVATFCLMILVLSLGHSKPVNGISFLYVYISLSGGVMAFAGLTGYAINPVRDLMPRIVHAIFPIQNKGGSDWEYAWVPIVGPCLGAVLAALLHNALFTGI